MNKKRKIIIGIICALVLITCASSAFVYQAKLGQDRQVKIEEEKAYQELKVDGNKAVDLAYDSREDENIKNAHTSIGKLKADDQSLLKERMVNLEEFLKEIKRAEEAMAIASESKSNDDLESAQEAIDELSDEYEAKDKLRLQKSLEDLKKSIADEKARAEEERKALEQAKSLSQANALDYVRKYLEMKGYILSDFILHEPRAELSSVFDVDYQGSDGTGAGTFRVEKITDNQVLVRRARGSFTRDIDFSEAEYVTLP